RPICRARTRIQFFQDPVVQLLRFHFRYAAIGVVEVAENNRFGRTGLLARRQNLAVAHLPAFFLRVDLGFVNTLHAVSTLLHDTARAHGHVGIPAQLEAGSVPILIQEEVEAPHLIRAIVRAVARAYAAVVDHVVEAFARVTGRLHGTHQLAGRILAVHARHGLIVDGG